MGISFEKPNRLVQEVFTYWLLPESFQHVIALTRRKGEPLVLFQSNANGGTRNA